MPWSNQNNGNGGNGSPWGGGSDPRNSHGRSPRSRSSGIAPSDMDELLRKGQEQLKQFGGGNSFVLLLAFVGVAFWFFRCFYIVQQNEQAVELRFGRPKEEIVSDGLHFHFWPVDSYRKISRTEQAEAIGAREQDGLMLSGDQNIVDVNFSVYYYIVNPSEYLFNVNDQRGTVQQVAESAMREVVGRRPADDIYRDKREAVAAEVRSIIQLTLEKYGIGVDVTRVSITEAAPPREVAEAFNSVQQAEQERNRAIEQGNQVRAKKRGIANGEASRIREEAAAYKARIVQEALGEAQRFSAVASETRIAPQATRFRLYLEAVEQVLSSANKLVLDKSGNGVIPYLPIHEFMHGEKTSSNGIPAVAEFLDRVGVERERTKPPSSSLTKNSSSTVVPIKGN